MFLLFTEKEYVITNWISEKEAISKSIYIRKRRTKMKVTTTVAERRQLVKNWKKEEKSVGLVPIMGFLHEGHASLIKKCREENDIVVVSDL